MTTNANDSTTVLNLGVGGDTMDVSAVSNDDGSIGTLKRERILIGGEKNRDALAEVALEQPPAWAYGMPTRDLNTPEAINLLGQMNDRLDRICALLELVFTGSR